MNKKQISALTLTAMLSSLFLHSEEGALHITGHSEPYTLTENALPSLEEVTADTSSSTPAQDGGIVPLSPAKPKVSTTPEPTPSTDSTAPSEEAPAPQDESTPPPATESTTSPATAPSEEPAPEEEGTPVGQAAKSGARDARNRTWQNIGLAAATVAVAVTAIILVSSNSGHRK